MESRGTVERARSMVTLAPWLIPLQHLVHDGKESGWGETASDRDNYCVHASCGSDKSETKVCHHVAQRAPPRTAPPPPSSDNGTGHVNAQGRGIVSRHGRKSTTALTCCSFIIRWWATTLLHTHTLDLAECRHHASTSFRVRVASSRRSEGEAQEQGEGRGTPVERHGRNHRSQDARCWKCSHAPLSLCLSALRFNPVSVDKS
jgi:hypothetical protein